MGCSCQAPLSRQEYWSGLPFPSPGDLPNPEIEHGFPALQADYLPLSFLKYKYLAILISVTHIAFIHYFFLKHRYQIENLKITGSHLKNPTFLFRKLSIGYFYGEVDSPSVTKQVLSLAGDGL